MRSLALQKGLGFSFLARLGIDKWTKMVQKSIFWSTGPFFLVHGPLLDQNVEPTFPWNNNEK